MNAAPEALAWHFRSISRKDPSAVAVGPPYGPPATCCLRFITALVEVISIILARKMKSTLPREETPAGNRPVTEDI